ncbi:MAG: RNA-directed DNA polymerase [Verrucomicrobiae bacterium]|nr:RNA-directed DNA polymerase [Verrucomicrobiae bacterium]
MSWEDPNFITLSDLYLAYRKAKVDVYYEKVNIAGVPFCKYEVNLDRNLRSLLKQLSSDRPAWMTNTNFIGSHSYIPKSIEPDPRLMADTSCPHFFSSDADKRWDWWCQQNKDKPEASFRLVGQHPVDFHIVSTLWIMKVGQYYDACLGVEAKGSRLRRYTEVENDLPPDRIPELNPYATGCFRPYAVDYKNWRSSGLAAIRKSLENKESVVAITMDIRQFYHRVCPEFLLDPDFLDEAKLKLSADQKTFTRQMITALATWAQSSGQPETSQRPIGLPVGLTASKVIANVALLAFDRAVKRELSPIYYGRYVDDVFLVIRDTGEFSSSSALGQFIVDRLRGLLRKADTGNSYRFVPVYDKERSLMEFAEAKQKMFLLSGQAGLDLLDGIEQQVNDASSEWRMLADLPDDEGELLKNILCPGRDASAAVDNLRKADGVSVRRLEFSLVLRNLEAIERDLPPSAWKKQRKAFFDVVFNHILTIPGVFDFFPFLTRLLGLSVACGEFDIAVKLVRRFQQVMRHMKQTTRFEPTNAVASCLEYTARAFALSVLQALGPSPNVKKSLWRLWKALDALADGRLAMTKSEISSAAFQLWLHDLGRQSYRESLMKRGTLAAQARVKFPPIKIDVVAKRKLRVAEIEAFIEAAQPLLKRTPFLGALVFPTRPFSPAEITQLIPESLNKPQILWRFVKALRGLAISPPPGNGTGQKTIQGDRPIRLPVENAPAKPLVALPCLLTHLGSWRASVRGQIDPDKRRYFRINRLVNDILRHPKKPHYIIFPELSIPRNWFGRIAYKLAKSGISVIAGLEYEHHGHSLVSNQVWASLVTDVLGYRSSVIYWQEKEEAALHEERELWQQARLRLAPMGAIQKPVIQHGLCAFGLLVCSELTDMQNRLRFRGNVDAIFVAEWNQDTKTFASLVEAAALDVHCYVVQVNNRAYGDCRIRAPAKEDHNRDLVRLKGGVTDYFVVGELDVPALREFQSQARSPDKPFKPVPSGFELAPFRQSPPSLNG